jgi:hypothetical protein
MYSSNMVFTIGFCLAFHCSVDLGISQTRCVCTRGPIVRTETRKALSFSLLLFRFIP